MTHGKRPVQHKHAASRWFYTTREKPSPQRGRPAAYSSERLIRACKTKRVPRSEPSVRPTWTVDDPREGRRRVQRPEIRDHGRLTRAPARVQQSTEVGTESDKTGGLGKRRGRGRRAGSSCS